MKKAKQFVKLISQERPFLIRHLTGIFSHAPVVSVFKSDSNAVHADQK